jgi:hypothetical protein
MKILLDENIDVYFANFLRRYEVFTVNQMGWNAKKNGELLSLASEFGINFFVTLDKNIKYQQSLKKYNMKFIVLNVINSRIETLQLNVSEIVKIIESNPPTQLFEIDKIIP